MSTIWSENYKVPSYLVNLRGQAGLYAMIISWRRKLGKPDLIGPKAWSDWFVENKLIVDLGKPGWDARYGNGLVDINKTFDLMLDSTLV